MNFLRLLAVALAIVVVGCAPKPEPVETVDPIELMRGATRQLEAVTPEGPVGYCSGVMVTQEYFITAAHCDLTGEAEMQVGGKTAIRLRKNEETDVMVMHVPAGCPCVPHVASVITPDEKVYAVGYPVSEDFTPDVQVLTEGLIMGVNNSGYLLFTAPVTWGNSGGPVFVIHHGAPVIVAIVSHGTVVPLGGFIPVIVGHLNYGPAGPAILELFFAALGVS